MADHSSTITAADTSQQAAASDGNRQALLICNPSGGPMFYNFGTAAVQDSPSIQILPGDTHFYGREWRELIMQPIHIIGAVEDAKFTIKASC